LSVVLLIPTWNVSPLTGGVGNSVEGVPVPGAMVTESGGALESLAVMLTNTGLGTAAGGVYAKVTLSGDADKVDAAGSTAGAAITRIKQIKRSFRAWNPKTVIIYSLTNRIIT
jgi:hypothetical protein